MKDTTIARISGEAGKVSKQLRVSRPKLVSFFAKQSAATVLLEACGSPASCLDLADVSVEGGFGASGVAAPQDCHRIPTSYEPLQVRRRHLFGSAAQVDDVGEVDRITPPEVLPPSSVATRLRAVVQVWKRPGCAP